MKSATMFRIAAVLFLVFAIGHTAGFLSFRPSTAEGLATYEAMNRVHFAASHRAMSYGGWYRGFGLSITASLLFSSFLAWHLGSMAKRGSTEVAAVGWAFFAWQIPGLVLSLLYFGIPPMVLGLLVTLLIGWASLKAGKFRESSRP